MKTTKIPGKVTDTTNREKHRGKAPYVAPRILSREHLEAVAAVCSTYPGKQAALGCPAILS